MREFLAPSLMNPFVQEMVHLISEATEMDEEAVHGSIEVPPDERLGDYAFPCFVLAKRFKKSPALIAQELAERIQTGPYVSEVRSAGPYLNFVVDKQKLVWHVLGQITEQGLSFGTDHRGTGKTVVLDFSSPNIAKPIGVHHLRSTALGNALYKIHDFLGYRCVRINHLGDWGTQFGQVVVAYKRWGDQAEVEADPIVKIMELYVKFHEEAEKNPALHEEARDWFNRMEQEDEEALGLWRWLKEETLRELRKVYDTIDVQFDSYAGESFYIDMLDDTIQEIVDTGLAVESEGALIVSLDQCDMPPCMLRKRDGSSLYATRDITAALYRFRKYHFDKMIYTTDTAQILHFKQFFKVLELMEKDWANRCVHVPFGRMNLKDGTMSTRKGRVILLEDLLDRATELTGEIIERKNPHLENKDQVAREVGVGAVIFADLSTRRAKDVVFDWDEVLNFDGDTGPYLQYTHARFSSVLRKYGEEVPPKKADLSLLEQPEEITVVKILDRFPGQVQNAAEACEPSLIASYLIDLATAANRFYNTGVKDRARRVIGDDPKVTDARIVLTYGVKVVLERGLKLLGMKSPERM